MDTVESLLALEQMEKTIIKSAVLHADRLVKLRGEEKNFKIAVLRGGGMAVVFVKGDKTRGPHYRLGPVYSQSASGMSDPDFETWNRSHPEQAVERIPVQDALKEECARICMLLSQIDKRRRELEAM